MFLSDLQSKLLNFRQLLKTVTVNGIFVNLVYFKKLLNLECIIPMQNK